MPLYFTGFMGAGKSTLAKLVAQEGSLPLYDTDLILAEAQGQPISAQLIQDAAGFRRREAELIARLVHLDCGIISLGGGAMEDQGTRSLLQGKPVIFLDPGVDICWRRVQASSQARPLATDYDAFLALYEKRLPLYLSVCRWHLADNLPPEQLLAKLAGLIRLG